MLRKTIYLIGLCLVITTCGRTLHAQTINAASCNASDVQSALSSVNQATATVVIPSGTCSWTSSISFTVPSSVTNLTIQGQTSMNCSGTAGTSSYACPATDNTVIVDDYPTGNPGGPLLSITTGAASSSFRMTGITLRFTSDSIYKYTGIVDLLGSSSNVRLDHLHCDAFTNSINAGTCIQIGESFGSAPVEGVADHDLFDLYPNNSFVTISGIRVGNDINDNIGNGDGAWASPSNWGSSQFFFIESSVFNGSAPNDCENSGRFVMRYDYFNNISQGVQNHATKSDVAPARGCREEEIYHNYFTGPTANPGYTAIGTIKGGPALIWGNTVAQGYSSFLVAETDRNGITGDERTPANGGWGTCWNGAGSPPAGAVGPTVADGNEDSYGYPCLDGIGRGQTATAMTGSSSMSARAVSWPNQYLEPIYAWMNTLSTSSYGYTQDRVTHANRDLYFDCDGLAWSGTSCSSFNGTQGTGTGLLSARPSTCTAGPGGTYGQSPTGSYGVAYWATDQNTLYVCTATNTWTAIYTPYTYPHPLTAGTMESQSGPAAPTGLIATVQ